MKISFILPSKGRPGLFEKCVHQIISTTKPTIDVEVVTIAEDADTYGISLKLARKYNTDGVVIKPKVHISPKGAIFSWNQGLKHADGNYIIPMHDDVWPEVGWAQIALTSHLNHVDGNGMIGLNDGHLDGNTLATQVMYDRKFCIEHLNGSIACPHYHYLFIDNEFNERAKRAGKFYWEKEAYLIHNHPSHGTRKPDVNDSEHASVWQIDEKLFNERKEKGFPDNWEPFITE